MPSCFSFTSTSFFVCLTVVFVRLTVVFFLEFNYIATPLPRYSSDQFRRLGPTSGQLEKSATVSGILADFQEPSVPIILGIVSECSPNGDEYMLKISAGSVSYLKSYDCLFVFFLFFFIKRVVQKF